jgi:hypothetical protein
MMPTEEPDTEVQRLKQEIERLTHQHSEALRRAIYVIMSRDEAQKCDERRENIKKLVAELQTLERTNEEHSNTSKGGYASTSTAGNPA